MSIRTKCYLRKGDTVKVVSGEGKGKVGKISEVFRNKCQVCVTGINIKKKHVKPEKKGSVGRIIEFEAPIHSSNVMLYSEEKNLISRVSMILDSDGNKVRVLKRILTN